MPFLASPDLEPSLEFLDPPPSPDFPNESSAVWLETFPPSGNLELRVFSEGFALLIVLRSFDVLRLSEKLGFLGSLEPKSLESRPEMFELMLRSN